MTIDAIVTDASARLADLLGHHSLGNPTFWDFAEATKRSGSHAFFAYPAMMVPELQGQLLDDLIGADRTCETIYDPFMGSGTVMLEALYRGLSFRGSDINPLAVLLSEVKANPPTQKAAEASVLEVVVNARRSKSAILHDFNHRDKWFCHEAALQLSKLRTAIRSVESGKMRKFLWICLAESVRFVSLTISVNRRRHGKPPQWHRSSRRTADPAIGARLDGVSVRPARRP